MTETQTQPVRRAGRSPRRRLLPALLILAGVVVLLYPVAATQYNNVRQQAFAQQYNGQVQQASKDDLSGDLKRAHEYNATLDGVPILDPWLQRVGTDPGSLAFREYASVLGRFEAMARLRVPTADIDLPVFHGTSDPVLAKGVGHLYGTSLPVGGKGTHAVLTSHTGLTNATLFDHLTSVKLGDLMLVDVMGETLAYKVDQIKVVLPSEIGDLTAVPGEDYLTLFTCTPYAVNTHRLLVRGVRVPYVPEDAAPAVTTPTLKLEAWMWWLIAGAAVGVAAIVVLWAMERRRRNPRRSQPEA